MTEETLAAGAAAVGTSQGRGERVYQQVLTGTLFAFGFFIVYSTAGTNLAIAAMLALWLAAPRRLWDEAPWRQPVLAIGLVLLAYIVLRTLGGEGAGKASWAAIGHYQELLVIPLLWALLRVAAKPRALLAGLLVGVVSYALVHWLALVVPSLAVWLNFRRISAGFALAVGAFVLFEHARLGQVPRRAGYAAAVALALTVLFAIDGRTGHVILLLLAGCAAWRSVPKRWAVPALLAIVAGVLLVASQSDRVRARFGELFTMPARHVPGTIVTSTEVRVPLLRVATDVAREHFWGGAGFASYPRAYAQAADRVPDPDPETKPFWGHSDNPHNEYLMQLGAGGVAALGLFLLWVGAPMAAGLRRGASPWAGALGCVALAFPVGCLFNSLLLDFTEGHFYAALLAWGLARRGSA